MDYKRYFRDYRLFLICIILYLILTFPVMLRHIPYYDEAHAWMLANFMNFDNWIQIIKEEGHPLLWYLVLMPFAKLNVNYPYPMTIINYIFCISAVIIMWLKAPFSSVMKVIITFSSAFLIFFPICARNYSIGILGLFLLAAYYRNKIEHPLIYSLVIVLTINTHLICAFGASWFCIMLIVDLIKKGIDKKDLMYSILILLSGCLFFIFPYLSGYGCENTSYFGKPGLVNLLRFFLHNGGFLGIFYIAALAYTLIRKNLEAKFFILYVTILCLILFMFLYSGRAHHFIFLIIYLIFPFWIDTETEQKSNTDRILSYIIMGILLFYPLKSTIMYFYSAIEIFNVKNFLTRLEN